MVGGIDEKGIADPVPAGQELAKAESPASACCAAHRPRARIRAVDQQHQRAIADQKRGEKIKRREGACRKSPHHKGEQQPTPAAEAPYPESNPRHAGFNALGRVMRSLRTRRGSASSTWNSLPSGWVTISPRCGTRPSSDTTRPPRLSMSGLSSSSSAIRKS